MNNTILIIDDSTDVRENTNELLELAGYKTFTAINGKEGLEIAKKNKPDLILCDIMMPELDGYGVLRALENMPEMVGIPFIFFTAKTGKKDFRKGMDLGADDYLTKPFTGDDLLRVVDARLRKSGLMKKNLENNLEGLYTFINTAKTQKDISILSDQRKTKKMRNKDMLYMEGDSPNYLYFVVSGKIKTYKTNEWGKDYITEIYKQGDFFGYVPLFEDTKHKESSMAIEDSEIALIPGQDFFQLLYANKDVSMEFIKFMSHSLSDAEEKLLQMAYDSARKRVAEALLFISGKYKVEGVNEFAFSLNRENISALAGISPESVSRNLTDFREEGLIETENGNIRILDLRKLEKLKN
jgi:CRP-like cAMP-binding protein/FixJ family two-component response regulator